MPPVPSSAFPCAGLWASLQFRFLQLQYPGVVIAFEKMLMAGCLPVAAAVQVRVWRWQGRQGLDLDANIGQHVCRCKRMP